MHPYICGYICTYLCLIFVFMDINHTCMLMHVFHCKLMDVYMHPYICGYICTYVCLIFVFMDINHTCMLMHVFQCTLMYVCLCTCLNVYSDKPCMPNVHTYIHTCKTYMYLIFVYGPCTLINVHAWLPTYMYTYMHIYTIYTYYSHNNFVSADQLLTCNEDLLTSCCNNSLSCQIVENLSYIVSSIFYVY